MSDKKHWLTKLVPALAFAAGIIMSAVGGVMMLSSTAKLALFDTAPHSYISHDQCRYDYTAENERLVRSETEIETCLAEKQEQERERFKNNEKQDIVDGLAALIVGSILILSFRKRK